MTLTPKTKIDDLLKEYPFLLDFLAGLTPSFARLKSPILRKTIGRVATIQQAAGFGSLPAAEVLAKIRDEIKRVTGEDVAVESGPEPPAPLDVKAARREVLKDIIRELHRGGSLEEQKRRFAELVKDVSPAEIAEMEQGLIAEGLPAEEVKRLCDVHVQVFKESLETQLLPSSIPGHPLHTLREENRALEEILCEVKNVLGGVAGAEGGKSLAASKASLKAVWEDLAEVEKHYLKKENQLFPALEAKGVGGPSKVMWAIHDDIRAMLRDFRQQLADENVAGLLGAWREIEVAMTDMIYKEEKILFPLCLETLDERDWVRVRKGEEEVGYAWITPGREWTPAESAEEVPPLPAYGRPETRVSLDTGTLTAEQVNLILKNLPLDITYVDENDTVRYYSAAAERIFPRSPGIIGRKVQNCHPPASLHIVNRILEAFREGRREPAAFWIQSRGRFLHIRYFALRDKEGGYRGCIEVTQDVTAARGLQGERRLLDWK